MPTQFKLRKKIDGSIATVGLVLSLFGLVMVLSSSQFTAASNYGSAYYFFIHQLVAWVAGIVLFFYFLRVNIEELFAQRLWYLGVTLFLLILVLLIGTNVNGATRWFDLGVVHLQPAEFAKLFLTVYFAAWFASKGEKIRSLKEGLLPFLALLVTVCGLVILEKDMGTMLVITAVLMSMFFVARSHWAHLAGTILIGVLAIVLLINISPYRAQRLETFLGRTSSAQDTLGSNYHNYQAQVAIGSGGWWGEGFGQGLSKYSYLPEAQTDSIFAVIAEELGFVRTMVVVMAYAYIAWRGYVVIRHANSLFVKYLACGLTTAIIFQALINIGGMLSIIPLTGVPLPFISYGGSSMIVCLSILGLLTNVSREVKV